MPEHWLPTIIGWLEALLRLGLVIVAGTIIGLEREYRGHSAGLRTHTLVGLGAALFTLLSESAVGPGAPVGRTRVTAGIAQGIGFLGAGTILKEHNRIKGLTTAASIWVMGALGIAAGMGEYALGAIATATAYFVLKPLKRLERSLIRSAEDKRTQRLAEKPEADEDT